MKKLFTLLTLLCAVTGVWAQDYYTPTADEVIVLNDIYSASATGTGYSTHAAVAWAGTASSNSKKAGDPNNNGEATSSNVPCYSIKNNGKGKNITLTISGVSKVTLYHEKHSSRYPMLLDANNDDAVIGTGDAGVYFNEFELNASNDYTIKLQGTSSGTNQEDLYVYAIKLEKGGPSEPVDPVFSLSADEIGLDETAQIKVNAKSGLDGLTMNDLAYDATVISIDETGKITPVAVGTSTITFTTAAVESKYNAGSANLSIIVTAPVVATPVISPADGSKFYGESQVVTATCATEGAVLSYSIDNEATWTVLPEEGITITETTTIIVKAEKDGYVASKATATITKEELVLDERQDIAASATWDWSKYGTKEIKTENTPFYRETVLVSNVEKYGYAAPAEDFGPAQALTLKGDYIVRDSKYCQVTEATFKTSVPGTVGVVFSNTGGSRPYRYLSVNGKLTEFKSNVSNATTEATGIEVSAGEVVINGVVDPEAETNYEGYTGNDAGQINFLRIYSITFTAGGTDGIQTVNNNAANNGVIYNLAGQRVMNAQKGLFIINGNKVVIK